MGDPLQTPLSSSEPVTPITLEKAGATWRMTPRAEYRVAARVLNSRRYHDWQARFTPVDLALGWGKVSESRADRWVEWRQSDRWYYYRLRRSPLLGGVLTSLSPEYVREHSANVHVVPATAKVESALKTVERNSLVLMEGKLVDVEAEKDGAIQRFSTSLSRSDGGDGSCEIMYVERLVTEGLEYR